MAIIDRARRRARSTMYAGLRGVPIDESTRNVPLGSKERATEQEPAALRSVNSVPSIGDIYSSWPAEVAPRGV
jgi:hypothetical protein